MLGVHEKHYISYPRFLFTGGRQSFKIPRYPGKQAKQNPPIIGFVRGGGSGIFLPGLTFSIPPQWSHPYKPPNPGCLFRFASRAGMSKSERRTLKYDPTCYPVIPLIFWRRQGKSHKKDFWFIHSKPKKSLKKKRKNSKKKEILAGKKNKEFPKNKTRKDRVEINSRFALQEGSGKVCLAGVGLGP